MSQKKFTDLNGKICVITGGAGIIGSTLAIGLVTAGVKVALLDIDEKKAKQRAREIDAESEERVFGIGANVLDKESIEAALHPASGTVLYYVAKGDGGHEFSDTFKEQDEATKKYLKRK